MGEQPIQPRSVFDYIKQQDRKRIETLVKPKEKLNNATPYLDPQTAKAALSGYAPFNTNTEKQMRYREFLEFKAGHRDSLPQFQKGMEEEDIQREYGEFMQSARIFKPMTGEMASRFTSAKAAPVTNDKDDGSIFNTKAHVEVQEQWTPGLRPGIIPDAQKPKKEPLVIEEEESKDPRVKAAKQEMFGALTRIARDWTPERLLYKRFNVAYPT